MSNPAPINENRHKDARVFYAELIDSFWMAMDALRSHKLRSALTLLGILVGVFSIIVVMTTIRAMQTSISNELNSLGGQTFYVSKWPAISTGDDWEKYYRRKEIVYRQALILEEKATLAKAVGMSIGLSADDISSRYAPQPTSIRLVAHSPGSFEVQNWNVVQGRAILPPDNDSARDVCVIGDHAAKTLFPGGSPLGESVRINSISYTVIGVLESKGAATGGGQDNLVIIPLTTGLNRWGAWRWSCNITIQARDAATFGDAQDQVRGILRSVRKVPPGEPDDFEILTPDSIMGQINKITFAVRIGVIVISSISLLAAGIGIMNIMLVSVTERTREIGIRRAIGAKKRNIMTQFIMEAIVLCEVGGVLGVLAGISGGNLAGHFMKLPVVIPIDSVLLGLGICSLVGLIFGTYPAYKAANLDPIESLRYE